MKSPVKLGVSPAPHKCFHSEALRLYFPVLEPWIALSHSSVVPPSLSTCKCGTACSASCHLARPGPLATTLPPVLSAQLSIAAPPTGLDECFFFNSLVVRLPHSLIFCEFWFLFLNLMLSFFWLCEEAHCVYPRLHLGQTLIYMFLAMWFFFFYHDSEI